MTITVWVTVFVVPSANVTVEVSAYEPTFAMVKLALVDPLASVLPDTVAGPLTAPSLVVMVVLTGAPTRAGEVFVVEQTVVDTPGFVWTYDPTIDTVVAGGGGAVAGAGGGAVVDAGAAGAAADGTGAAVPIGTDGAFAVGAGAPAFGPPGAAISPRPASPTSTIASTITAAIAAARCQCFAWSFCGFGGSGSPGSG